MVPNPDYLTEALDTFPPIVRFAGRIDVGEPWSASLPEGIALVSIVTKGSLLAMHRGDREPVRVSAGDVLFLSPGTEHQLVVGRDPIRLSAPAREPREANGPHGQNLGVVHGTGFGDGASLRPSESRQGLASAAASWPHSTPYPDWVAAGRGEHPHVLSCLQDGKAPDASLIGGLLEFDDPCVHPFLWALPPLVHLDEQAAGRSVHLQSLRRSFESEVLSDSPGRVMLIRRLVEILLIEAIRICTEATDDASENPLGCLLHPDLGPALNLMHRQPEKSWTVAELAEHVAMSRSAFAAAFTEALGRPPVQYLRERRMVLAGRLLRNHSLGLKEVAMRVGYDSVSAFNSAFRQCWGIAPGRFRAERSDDRLMPRASAARGSKGPPPR